MNCQRNAAAPVATTAGSPLRKMETISSAYPIPATAQTSKKKKPLDYAVGDTVSHLKFGTGVVKQIIDGGRDYEVTVDFSGVGVKKMFASFAKLKKL